MGRRRCKWQAATTDAPLHSLLGIPRNASVFCFSNSFVFFLFFGSASACRADRFWFSWQWLHRRAADVADEYAFGGMPTGGMGPDDEEAGSDELDEGYLTRGGAEEASWPAPQQAHSRRALQDLHGDGSDWLILIAG